MGIRSVLAGGGAVLAGLAVRPTVTLTPESVDVDLPPDGVVSSFRDRMSSGTDVIAAGDRVVRRFSGRAGPFRYSTVEVVAFTPTSVTFDHLRGPFASCSERFDVTPRGTGATLTHSGTFALRGGLYTWPLARTAVKWAFERHVSDHMRQLAGEGPVA